MDNERYRVLLVEDDALDQMAYEKMVESEKLTYDSVVAGTVTEARNVLDTNEFDVVVSDYMLPDGTGLDVLDLIKKRIPTIFVTGTGDEEVAVKAMKGGACDYLIKDLQHSYLRALPVTIENAIRHKRMEDRFKLLSHAVMSTDDSIYISDMQDKIIFVNRAFCEVYGYKEDEIMGKDSNILWEKNPASPKAKQAYEASSGWEVGFYHKRKDGGQFPVSLTRSAIKDENGQEIALVCVARDISEHICIEDDLRTENLKLKNLLKVYESAEVGKSL